MLGIAIPSWVRTGIEFKQTAAHQARPQSLLQLSLSRFNL